MKAKVEKFNIPKEVSHVTQTLKKTGFGAFLVGGCVRDLFMGRKPKDWDITTDATPNEIIPLFIKTFYENEFGTVGVVNKDTKDETLKIIEITPYRVESSYSDYRRPDSVKFSKNILDDLKRRDFTINAIAYDPENSEIIDPFKGITDLSKGIIKTVGNPNERFSEDGLRILRAIRLHVELDFPLHPDTEKSILKNGYILKEVSRERIRDEFLKIIMSNNPMNGFLIMKKLGLLKNIIPELEQSVGVEQSRAHVFDVWNHTLKAVQHAANKDYSMYVRLGALFHDIAKPISRRWDEKQKIWTFYGHEVVGSHVTKKILENLKFSRETIDKVTKLVRWHMFFSDTEKITLSAVRRLIANVGTQNVQDLINIRECDRIGMGRPKENPYRLRKYRAMIDEVMRDPVSVGMLKIDGKKIMDILKISSGPKVGYILNALLEEVLDNPKLNSEEYLNKRTIELSKMSDSELKILAEKGKIRQKKEEDNKIREIRGKYFVQ
ncbi:MAG: CCA tRNA nucleotidyltransferase [Candidatus Zambryskibacteria bacterium]|nr:CCA tRNA nucleotidyltransferase [Candidatus Zambryskibacteria bacterium]